jgi:hypothetical protein
MQAAGNVLFCPKIGPSKKNTGSILNQQNTSKWVNLVSDNNLGFIAHAAGEVMCRLGRQFSLHA